MVCDPSTEQDPSAGDPLRISGTREPFEDDPSAEDSSKEAISTSEKDDRECHEDELDPLA